MREAILVEYKALRDEQMVLYGRRAAIQNLGTALFAGLQVVAFIEGIPEISIAATMIILAFWHDDIRWVEAMVKIGVYIRDIIEPQVPGLQWHTILEKVADPQRQTPPLASSLARLSSRYPMTATVGCGLSVASLLYSGTGNTLQVSVNLALIALSVLLTIRLFVMETDRGGVHTRWKDRFAMAKTEPNQEVQSTL
jgi:hypothetical protein